MNTKDMIVVLEGSYIKKNDLGFLPNPDTKRSYIKKKDTNFSIPNEFVGRMNIIKLNNLDLLHDLYGTVYIPQSVYDELTLNDVKFTVSKVTTTINVTVGDVTYPHKTVAVINIGNKFGQPVPLLQEWCSPCR